ncbi:MAG: HD domain-containing protein, partial [Heliobacteriaceae bacterium]|nr:HD domain-containing protein [Heliobacteriaceae bacterium]
QDKEFPKEHIGDILLTTNEVNVSAKIEMYNMLIKDPEFPKYKIADIVGYTDEKNIELAEMLCKDPEFPKGDIEYILEYTNEKNIELAKVLCQDKEFPPKDIADILQSDLANFLLNPETITNAHLSQRLKALSLIDQSLRLKLERIGLKVNQAEELLANSLASRRETINTAKRTEFIKVIANNDTNRETALKTFDFSQFKKEGVPLKYSREDFIQDISNLIKDLNNEQQNKLLNYFGIFQSKQGFDGLWNNKNIDNAVFSPETQVIAKEIKNKIEDFTIKNEVADIKDESIKGVLNGLIKGLPEFTSVIGKEQHGTHAYSVDVHTLKVLQTAMNDPIYKTLSDQDKTILKISILLHDIGKAEKKVDTGHAALSAEYTLSILDKFNLPDAVKARIADIVDNHHWFENYNKNLISAEDVATRCRRPEDFKIYQIFSKADFENVNDSFHLSLTGCKTQAEFDKFMADKMKAVEDNLNIMHSKANIVLDTKFTQAQKKFPTEKIEIEGKETELRVLNLASDKTNNDLFEYGFAPGITKESARFFVHMTPQNDMNTSMKLVDILLKDPTNQSTWSTSLIKLENSRTYSNRKFGFILDIDQANISEANYANTGSGMEKSIVTFTNILFNNNPARTYVRDNFKVELSNRGFELNDKEYGALAKYLYSKKYTTQIKDFTIGDKTIKAQDLIEALEISRDKLFKGGDTHSEIVPINPRATALIAKESSLDKCPADFLKFAQENNLPIILIGE